MRALRDAGSRSTLLHDLWRGSVTMPLEKQMWGDVFGMCVDPSGIQRMVNISQPAG